MLKKIFYLQILVFVLLMSFFVMPVEPRRSIFMVYAVIALVFLILGWVLIYLTKKSKISKKLKVFYLMTGWSAVMVLVGVILHNVFYVLGVVSENIIVLKYLMEGLGVAFFLIALLVCPVAFLVGVVGGLVVKK